MSMQTPTPMSNSIFVDEAWNLLRARPDKEWSLVDATSIVIMTQHSMTEALTTDHHFSQAGFIRLLAR